MKQLRAELRRHGIKCPRNKADALAALERSSQHGTPEYRQRHLWSPMRHDAARAWIAELERPNPFLNDIV